MTEVVTEPRPVGGAVAAVRRIAIVPAFNEQESVTHVIEEIRAFDPGLRDRRRRRRLDRRDRRRRRRRSGRTWCGCRSTSASAARCRPASATRSRTGSPSPSASTATASTTRRSSALLLAPVLADEADIVVGSRFAAGGGYRSSRSRRIGISILAGTLSAIVRRRVTDPTSGFQALNRRAIALFAADYPHDYPEVEAALMVHKHQLRMTEVPVQMRERSAGRSSIGALASVYYMVKVLLALFVGLFRRNVTPLEEVK